MFKHFLFLGLLLVFGACTQKNTFDIQNLNNNEIGVIGHGGIGFSSLGNDTPPNSMTSFQRAVDIYGANGLELDIQVNHEGQLFVFHDRSLYPSTNCYGCVFGKTETELKECFYRAGNIFPQQWKEPIVTLEKVISYFKNQDTQPILFLDIKFSPLCATSIDPDIDFSLLAESLLQLIREYAASDWIIIEPNNLTFGEYLAQQNSEIKLSWYADFTTANIALAKEHQFWGMLTSNNNATKSQIEAVHEAGLRASLFALKTQSSMVEAVKKNPDFLQTENIILLHEILNQ